MINFYIGKIYFDFWYDKTWIPFRWLPTMWIWSREEALKDDPELQGMFGDNDQDNLDYHIEICWLWFELVIEK